ncbi:MAG: hypothetical protein QM778_15435 [Myxococcales bacterium]
MLRFLSFACISCSLAALLSARVARAQSDAGVESDAAQVVEPPAEQLGNPAPSAEPAKEDLGGQDQSEAPPVLLSVPLPSRASAPAPASPASPRVDQAAVPLESEPEVESIPGDPWGDPQGLSVISLRALMQFRYTSTFATASKNELITGREKEDYLVQQGDGYSLNRMLVRLSSDPVKYLGFKSVLDFSELIDNDPEDVLKQAYAVLRPIPERLEFVAGLFKVPFSVLELDPTSRYEFANLGPANQLLNSLGFAGRDLGAQVTVAPLKKPKRLRLYLGAFRGHAHDEHDSPAGSLAARAESKPNKWLRLGADMVQQLGNRSYNRPFETSGKDVLPDPPDPAHPMQKNWGKGRAYSADIRIKRKGAMLRGEFMYIDRVDLDERYGAKSAWAAWGIAGYRFDVRSVQLLPALRAEWLDADREHGTGLWRTLSASLTLICLERVRFMLDVTRTDVQAHSPVLKQPKPLQIPPFMALDNTRVIGQLQVEL